MSAAPSDSPADRRAWLLTLPEPERARWLEARLAERAELPAGQPFLAAPPLPDGAAIGTVVRRAVMEVLGLPVYPRELAAQPTLRCLAGYLTRELAAPAGKPALAPATDLFAGGEWGWGEPPPPEGRQLPPAVFILSAPRSGSTLLRVMLEAHSALFAPPELNLLPFGRMGDRGRLLDRLGYTWMRRGLGSALSELEGLGAGAAEAALAALETENLPVSAVYRRLQRLAAPRLLVDKSPLYALDLAWLQRAETLFRAAKFIHLTRRPEAMMESFVRMRFHRLLGNHWRVWDEDAWALAEKVWTVANQQVLAFLDEVEPARQRRLTFETLVTRPQAALAELCEFLSLPYETGLANPYAGERMTRGLRPGEIAIGDPNWLTRSRIEPDRLTAWRISPPPQPLGVSARQVAGRLGYQLTDANAEEP